MRYLVKARLKPHKERSLLRAIDSGVLGKGSIAGEEYFHNMEQARLLPDGSAQWIEVCFCSNPLQEERPYWEEYFDLLSIQDAHARGNCRDLNGTEPWACCDCDCTRKLEQHLQTQGLPFLRALREKVASGKS